MVVEGVKTQPVGSGPACAAETSGCPPQAEFVIYASGDPTGLTAERVAEIDDHVEECHECQEQLETLGRWGVLDLQAELLQAVAPNKTSTTQAGWRRWNRVILGWSKAIAAAVLLVIGVFAISHAASHPGVDELRGLVKEELKPTTEELAKVLRELERRKLVKPPSTPPGDQFREDFEWAQQVHSEVDAKQRTRLILLLSDTIPDYFEGVQVIWDKDADPEMVYYWRDTDLNRILIHDFADRRPRPEAGPVVINVRLVFTTTVEARDKLRIPEVITRTIPFILTHQGIQLPSETSRAQTRDRFLSPMGDAEVSSRFWLTLSVPTPDATTPPAGPPTDRVLHVLVRSADLARWKDRYFITPVRIRPSELQPPGKTVTVSRQVSLRGMLEGVGSDHGRTVELELILVELPWQLRGGEVPESILPLDGPDMRKFVKDRRKVKLVIGKKE